VIDNREIDRVNFPVIRPSSLLKYIFVICTSLPKKRATTF